MIVYMMVTRDKYELPLAIADSVRELAEMIGKEPNRISSSMSHAKARGYKSPYRRVEIEDEVLNNDTCGINEEC